MVQGKKIHFDATLKTLPDILTWLHEQVTLVMTDKKQAMHFELALEEAVVNVVMHAYAQQGGRLEIEMQVEDTLTFILIDQGSPFDPVTAPLPEPDLTTEGGLGVKFMRLYCDTLHYEHRGHSNILTLSKNLS